MAKGGSQSILTNGLDPSMFNLVIFGTIILIFVIYLATSIWGYLKDKANKDNLKFPPFPSKCPDYWTNLGGSKCKNEHNIGLCKKYNGTYGSDIMDFSDDLFKGDKGLFYKCSWARKCKAPWEGIDKLCI